MVKRYTLSLTAIERVAFPALRGAQQNGLKEISIFDIFRRTPGYTRDELLAMTGFFTGFIQYVERCDDSTGMIYLKPAA